LVGLLSISHTFEGFLFRKAVMKLLLGRLTRAIRAATGGMCGFDTATCWGKGTRGMIPIGLALGDAILGEDIGDSGLGSCSSCEALFVSEVKNPNH
jgi:hypothetical protein